MGASTYTAAMVLPYNAAAVTTLDSLESEGKDIGQETPQINVRESPSNIAIDQGDNTVYVASSDSNTVFVIDGDTSTVSSPISVGKSPVSIAVDEDRDIAYVANRGSDTVSVINGTNYRNMKN